MFSNNEKEKKEKRNEKKKGFFYKWNIRVYKNNLLSLNIIVIKVKLIIFLKRTNKS